MKSSPFPVSTPHKRSLKKLNDADLQVSGLGNASCDMSFELYNLVMAKRNVQL